MATPELGASANGDLMTIRERLGRPIFPDPKSANKMVLRSVAETIGDVFKDKKYLKVNINNLVDDCKREGNTITPAAITAKSCFRLIGDVRRRVLFNLGYQGGTQSDNKVVAQWLDVVKGFQAVINGLDMAYDSTRQEKTFGDSMQAVGLGVIQIMDPKGFIFAQDLVKFWKNPPQHNEDFIKSYEDPKLIADGAKLALKTYRKMYPIAQKVLSSGN